MVAGTAEKYLLKPRRDRGFVATLTKSPMASATAPLVPLTVGVVVPAQRGVMVQTRKESSTLAMMQPHKVRYVVYEQDGAFVAQCLDVDVASEGDTEEEAVVNLRKARELYFDAKAPVMTSSRAVRFGEIVIHT